MSPERKEYPAEFKRQMVELVRAGRSPESLAKELYPSANTIRKWITQADIDEGLRADGLTTAERNELRGLRPGTRLPLAPPPTWQSCPCYCAMRFHRLLQLNLGRSEPYDTS